QDHAYGDRKRGFACHDLSLSRVAGGMPVREPRAPASRLSLQSLRLALWRRGRLLRLELHELQRQVLLVDLKDDAGALFLHLDQGVGAELAESLLQENLLVSEDGLTD